MNRLLFLDIDGVLNSTRYWDANKPLPMGKAGAIDPEAVTRLNTILERSGCGVVLTSSWRGDGCEETVRAVEAMLIERGFSGTLLGATPAWGPARWEEIVDWLGAWFRDQNPGADFRYVVLDDDPDAWSDQFGYYGAGRFVNTNYLVGLQDDGVAAALEWLGDASTSPL